MSHWPKPTRNQESKSSVDTVPEHRVGWRKDLMGQKRNTKHRKVFLKPPSKTQTHKKVCQFHLNLLDVMGLPAEVINIGLT